MKKILFFVCLMFFAIGVKALEPTLYYQNNIYSNRIGPENKIWSGQMAFIFMEGQIVYCLDPYLIVGKDYVIDSYYYLKPEDLEYYSIVTYYGYNLTNRNNIYYYMATQELIWEHIIGKGNVFWTTGQYNTGEKIDISQYKKEIEKDVEDFYKAPYLFNEYYLDSFENLLLHDENNVLHLYNMTKKGNSSIKKSGDDLIITMYDKDEAEIKLERQIKNNSITTFYHSPGGQTLAKFSVDHKKTMDIKIKLNEFKTNAYLNFYDEETKEKLDDVLFSICDLDQEINKTDKGYEIKNIKEGTYQLCNLDNPQDKSFEITKDEYNEELYIDIYLKPKKENRSSISVKTSVPLEKNEVKKFEEKNLIIPELPNTYDYETPIYVFLLSILLGSVFYKIK